ncbi:MAG: glycosyltransferase family 2 protein [Methanoregula sp.]
MHDNPAGLNNNNNSDKKKNPLLSVITPAYNEEKNIPELYTCLNEVITRLGISWEWIVIDDHSSDTTFDVIRHISNSDPQVRGIRLSRNHGSHTAIMCGISYARGDCAVIMAADLQDPPEVIPSLYEKWKAGIHVVWAVRQQREGIRTQDHLFARIYYRIMRDIVGIQNIHPSGADFFLIDHRVINGILQFQEKNRSILALVAWMGYKQDFIEYTKKARLHGESGWSFKKKITLVIDSITSFSYLPIRFMSYIGIITAIFGFLYALFIILNAITGKPPEGWSSLMVVILIIGGIQMVMLGVLGEYVWRALDESRKRPQFLIEETTS